MSPWRGALIFLASLGGGMLIGVVLDWLHLGTAAVAVVALILMPFLLYSTMPRRYVVVIRGLEHLGLGELPFLDFHRREDAEKWLGAQGPLTAASRWEVVDRGPWWRRWRPRSPGLLSRNGK